MATPLDPDSNNQLVEVPVAALKMVTVPAPPALEASAREEMAAGRLRKVVVRFRDGEPCAATGPRCHSASPTA
jgi:hypothetical protein